MFWNAEAIQIGPQGTNNSQDKYITRHFNESMFEIKLCDYIKVLKIYAFWSHIIIGILNVLSDWLCLFVGIAFTMVQGKSDLGNSLYESVESKDTQVDITVMEKIMNQAKFRYITIIFSYMMKERHGHVFRITSPLRKNSIGHQGFPLTKQRP